jgi:YebC/PmpR family DNA-binding regulatory protein
MAGHSHWAGIKHKKAREDAKRGKIFSRCARAITVAARQGGGDPAMNLALRYAIDEARAANMPKDSIERAVKKGTGELDDGKPIEEIVYEGYAPGGVAVLVEVVTDNRNRTAGEITKTFEKAGGSVGRPGCVAWMFQQKGLITVGEADEEQVMEVALTAGAEDMQEIDAGYEITTPPEAFLQVREALDAAGLEIGNAEIAQVPQSYVPLSEEDAPKVLRLMEALDDHDDVQKVHANFDIDADVLEKIQADA